MDGTPQTFATFVGIDVAKDHFDVAFLPEGTPCTLTQNAAGLRQLVDRLRRRGPCLIVLEATGGSVPAPQRQASRRAGTATVNSAQLRH
jgi:transposase